MKQKYDSGTMAVTLVTQGTDRGAVIHLKTSEGVTMEILMTVEDWLQFLLAKEHRACKFAVINCPRAPSQLPDSGGSAA